MNPARKTNEMYLRFGRVPDRRCKECKNLRKYRMRDGSYTKCTVYGDSRSEATDWSGRYLACGMFNRDYDGTPIYIAARHIETSSKNQMSLF